MIVKWVAMIGFWKNGFRVFCFSHRRRKILAVLSVSLFLSVMVLLSRMEVALRKQFEHELPNGNLRADLDGKNLGKVDHIVNDENAEDALSVSKESLMLNSPKNTEKDNHYSNQLLHSEKGINPSDSNNDKYSAPAIRTEKVLSPLENFISGDNENSKSSQPGKSERKEGRFPNKFSEMSSLGEGINYPFDEIKNNSALLSKRRGSAVESYYYLNPTSEVNGVLRDSLSNRDSITERDRDSITRRDRDSITTRDRDSITRRDRDSITKRDRDSITTRDRDSITTRDRDSITRRDRDSITKRDRDSNTTRDRDSITTRDRDSITTRDRDSITRRDRDSITKRDRDSITTRDRDSITRRDRTKGLRRIKYLNSDYAVNNIYDVLNPKRRDAKTLNPEKFRFNPTYVEVSRNYNEEHWSRAPEGIETTFLMGKRKPKKTAIFPRSEENNAPVSEETKVFHKQSSPEVFLQNISFEKEVKSGAAADVLQPDERIWSFRHRNNSLGPLLQVKNLVPEGFRFSLFDETELLSRLQEVNRTLFGKTMGENQRGKYDESERGKSDMNRNRNLQDAQNKNDENSKTELINKYNDRLDKNDISYSTNGVKSSTINPFSTFPPYECCHKDPHILPLNQRDNPNENTSEEEDIDEVQGTSEVEVVLKEVTPPPGYKFDPTEVGGGKWVGDVWEPNTIIPSTERFYFGTTPTPSKSPSSKVSPKASVSDITFLRPKSKPDKFVQLLIKEYERARDHHSEIEMELNDENTTSKDHAKIDNLSRGLLMNLVDERVRVEVEYSANSSTVSVTINSNVLLIRDYLRPAFYPWKYAPDHCTNYAVRFLKANSAPLHLLVSFPGSGNSWVRYLSESLTGIFTGSMYRDKALYNKGLKGELDSFISGTTLVQKTHSHPQDMEKMGTLYGVPQLMDHSVPLRVTLLIRSPYDALIALRHYHGAGHTGFAGMAHFAGKDWEDFTSNRSKSWYELNKAWITRPNTSLLVIHYEDLKEDMNSEMLRLLSFIGVPVDYGRLQCANRYSEGKFKRPSYPRHLQGYEIPRNVNLYLEQSMVSLSKLLRLHGHRELPRHLYRFIPPTQAIPPTKRIPPTQGIPPTQSYSLSVGDRNLVYGPPIT